MWLDRLGHSGAGSPANHGGSRTGSPLPLRKTSGTGTPTGRSLGAGAGPYMTSQRSARNSSMSLLSNDSTASLLASAQRPNGSGLKQSTTRAQMDASEERAKEAAALSLLGKLLGVDAGAAADAAADDLITDDDLELDFDFRGLSLRQMAWSRSLQTGRDGNGAEDDSEIEHGEKQASGNGDDDSLDSRRTKLEDLHKSIQACDEALSSVETNLTNFRNDLALVSSDIESLQARSTALNVRLENRRTVEKGLAAAVEDLSVSPALVHKIVDGHIDEQWIAYLKEVDRRVVTVRHVAAKATPSPEAEEDENSYGGQGGHGDQKPSKAVEDLLPLLDKLVLKAVERIRDFLVAQIKSLRSPHINAQIIQQQSFLRFRDLYTFLHKHHATLADEICLAYQNTMRWYYSTQFSRYTKSLEKLRLHVLDKNDVLGRDDALGHAHHHATTSLSASGSIRPAGAGVRHDAFSIGRRIDLLKGSLMPLPSSSSSAAAASAASLASSSVSSGIGSSVSATSSSFPAALTSYLAEEDTSVHYLEVPFRHLNLAIIDNATAEYTFLASFFAPALSFATIGRHFQYIFEPTFALGEARTRTLTADTLDCLGVLLCIRLNQQAAFALQRRKVPAVDGYVNATNMLLWPRFQQIMDRHCESLSAAADSLSSSSLAPSSSTASTAPHVITQRFGQLLHGILALSTEDSDNEPIATSLHRLRSEFEAFLTRYSQAGGLGKDRRKRERFLYNNYSLVLTIISDVQGGNLASEQMQHIENLKAAFEEAQ